VIYLDSSAILKLLRREDESDALIAHLDAHAQQELVTSALATVEVARALTAVGAADTAARSVRRSDRIEIGDVVVPALAMVAPVLDVARTLPPAVLRSLDAIHVATAMLAREALDHLITYDKRMAAAARATGIRTVSPS
jgi:predicted nucleic acid-binding protein